MKLFILLLFLLILSPTISYAHVLEKDGTIGAVVHITPDDDPIVGEQSSFFFEFKDTTDKFKPQDCDCVVTILKNGQEIYRQSLFQDNSNPTLSNASFTYIFSEKNIYTVLIQGKPNTQNAFQPFTLSYDLRISREKQTREPTTPWLAKNLFPIVIGIIGVGVAITLISKKKRTSPKGVNK